MEALIAIDLQNDFMPGGALAVPHGDEVIPAANRLMTSFDLVVATQDWHPENHGSFAAAHPGRKVGAMTTLGGVAQLLWPVHCVQGSDGASFHPALDSGRFSHIVRKGSNPAIDSYSGFFDNDHRTSTGLESFLRQQRVERVYVFGLATDYCVKYTAIDAAKLGFVTFVIDDACRGVNVNPGDVQRSLDEMRAAGITIVRVDDVLRRAGASTETAAL